MPFKARAEPSRLRQMWLATLLSQAPGGRQPALGRSAVAAVHRLSGAWPRSLPYCPAHAANRRSVWITGPSGGRSREPSRARECGPRAAFSPVS